MKRGRKPGTRLTDEQKAKISRGNIAFDRTQITNDQVRRIRLQRHYEGTTFTNLAKQEGLSVNTINKILNFSERFSGIGTRFLEDFVAVKNFIGDAEPSSIMLIGEQEMGPINTALSSLNGDTLDEKIEDLVNAYNTSPIFNLTLVKPNGLKLIVLDDTDYM